MMKYGDYKEIIDTLKHLGFKVEFTSNIVFELIIAQYFSKEKKHIVLSTFHGKAPEGFNDLYVTTMVMENDKSYNKYAKNESMHLYCIGEAMGIASNYIEELNQNGF